MKTSEEYKELSVREFTKAARNYENDKAGIYKMCRKDYPPILEEIKKKPFEELLDAGCGTAPMISLLSEEYPDAHFTGLDLTPEMIKQAKNKGLKNADFIVGDCEKMPFEDTAFDIVINSQSFHHYPDPQAFFNEVARVLKPGGKLILRDNTGAKPVIWLVNHIELPLANLIGHGDVKAHTIEEVRGYCKKAGLTIEKIEKNKGFRLHLVARKAKTTEVKENGSV